MTCVHLRQLYQLCLDHQVKLSSSDLIHVVCQQCGKVDVCPSTLLEDVEDPDVAAAPPPGVQTSERNRQPPLH